MDYLGLYFAYTQSMPGVLMNFGRYRDSYNCHFVQGDARSTIGTHTRFFQFATFEELNAFFLRCHPEDPDQLIRDMRRWGQGSAFCNLTDEQYRKLERATNRRKPITIASD